MDTQVGAVRIPVTAGLAIVVLIVIDLAARFSLGPVSVNGALTLVVAGVCASLVPLAFLANRIIPARASTIDRAEPFLTGTRTIPIALSAFLLWAVMRLLVDPTAEGLQNVAVYLAFVAGISVTATTASGSTARVVLRWMRRVAVIASLAFIAASFTGSWLYGARSFALVALVYLAVLIPHTPQSKLARLAPYAVTVAIVLSLSRTATLVALVMMFGMILRGRQGRRLAKGLVASGAVGAAGYWLFANFQPLRDRFFGGDAAVTIGEVSLNTSGRANLWDLTVTSADKAPWLGQGPGSASQAVMSVFPGISHPHNEYLRIMHDLGYVGLALFLIAMGALVHTVWRRARETDGPVHWSALLALSSVLASAVTDNPLVYLHVMLPVGVIVGLSLAGPSPARELEPARERGSRTLT